MSLADPDAAAPPLHAAGLGVRVAGETGVCRPSGALWLEAFSALVVADLHLEKGSAYARRGQLLPPYDTRETLRRLAAEAGALQPRRIVLLGDSFHDGGGEGRLCAQDAAAIGAIAQGRELIWITGNHDREGPRALPGERRAEVVLGRLRLTHEPSAGAAPGEVAGHLHPCAKVRGGGASVRRRCFVTDGERIVLPAFGALAGGLNVRHPAFAPLFPRPPRAGLLGRGRVYALDWALLVED